MRSQARARHPGAPRSAASDKGEHLPGDTMLAGPGAGDVGGVEEVAVGAPLLVGVGAAGGVVLVGTEQHERRCFGPAVTEAKLQYLVVVRAGRARVAAGARGGEDAEDVLGAPGPKPSPVEIDLVPVGANAQAGRADDVALVVEAQRASLGQGVDRCSDCRPGVFEVISKLV